MPVVKRHALVELEPGPVLVLALLVLVACSTTPPAAAVVFLEQATCFDYRASGSWVV